MRREVFAGLLSLALFAPASSVAEVYPQSWTPVAVSQFGGLDLLHDSAQVAPSDSIDATNVLTDSGYLEKRPGNVLLSTILSGYKVQYVGEWVGPSGGRYLIAQASNTIYQTNFSAAPIALSTVASGYSINVLPAYSKLFFADGLNSVWQWNETSTATVTDAVTGAAAPVCTYLAFKDDRTFCANIPTEGTSRVRVSSAGGVGYWVVPSNFALIDNAPFVVDIKANDGDYITCLAASPWGVFIGKRYSSYILQGTGNLTYTLRTLDTKIGCVDNRSVQMAYGVLRWLGVDGVYGYDGKGPPQILSRELDPLLKKSRASTFAQGQWSTQLQGEWATGAQSTTTASLPPLSWDYNSVPGSVFPTSFTLRDDNTNPAATSPYVGFSSDTLVGIDTTSAPGSSGYAQIQASTSGIQVWFSSYVSGAFTTGPTTWTVYSGYREVSCASQYGVPLNTVAAAANAICGQNVGVASIYTMAPSSAVAPAGGWSYGHWTVSWAGYGEDSVSNMSFGNCGNAGAGCWSLDFISNSLTEASKTAYALEVLVNTNPGWGGFSTYDLILAKYVLGVRTVLGQGTVNDNAPIAAVFKSSNSTSVTKYGGNFTIWNGTTVVFNAYDADYAQVGTVTLAKLKPYQNLYGGGTFSTAMIFGVKHQGYPSIATITSRIFDTGQRIPVAGAQSSSYTLQGKTGETQLAFYVRSSTSPNNDMWTSYAASSNGVVASLPNRFWQYKAIFNTSVASATPRLSAISFVAISTGLYFSRVNFIGTTITSWRQFNVSEADPTTYRFYIRSATIPFTIDSATPSWTLQAANQDITVSTGAYVQFAIDSRLITNADEADALTAAFVRWNEGASIPVASASLDRRYFLCVAIATSTLVPDTCLIQQKNGKWVYWTGPDVSSMGIYNYNIIIGDGSTGSKVWYIMQPGVYSDGTVAIDARWVTPDYTNGLIFNDKILHEEWVDALPVLTSSVTLSYMTDKSGTWNDTEFYLDNGKSVDTTFSPINALYGSINKWVPPAAGYDRGKYLRFKFENDDVGAYYRINSFLIYLENEGRTVP